MWQKRDTCSCLLLSYGTLFASEKSESDQDVGDGKGPPAAAAPTLSFSRAKKQDQVRKAYLQLLPTYSYCSHVTLFASEKAKTGQKGLPACSMVRYSHSKNKIGYEVEIYMNLHIPPRPARLISNQVMPPYNYTLPRF